MKTSMNFDDYDQSDASFEDVETFLDADLDDFRYEVGELYDEMERYVDVAKAMDSAGREEDADYFREIALETYKSLLTSVQLRKHKEGGDPVHDFEESLDGGEYEE